MGDYKLVRVLAVEDNPGDTRLLHEMLQEPSIARFELACVERLGEALQCLGQDDYDIVLLDLGLPDGQGLDTFLAVNEQRPDIPIVVLTGTDDKDLALRAVRHGAQDYLVKGHFDGDLLVRSASYAMERKLAEIQKRRLLQEATLFSEIAVLMASAEDTSAALQEACAKLASFLRVPQAGFAVLDAEWTAAKVIADYRPPDSPGALGIVLPVVGNPAMEHILEYQTPLAVTDAQTDPRLAPVHDVMRQRKVASILIVPVTVGRQVLGTLGFDAYERHIFTDSEIDLVQRVANQMGQLVLRKQAEEAREEAYSIIRMSPAVAFVWRNDEGWPVEYVTDNVEVVFGYTREEFVSGRVRYSETVHPDDLERVTREMAMYSQEEGREEFVHEPYRIVAKDGRVRWMDDRTHIRWDESGQVTHYQGIVLDITERRKAEEALRDSEEKLSSIVEHAGVGIVVIQDGQQVFYNARMYEMLGYTEAEYKKFPFLSSVHPGDRPLAVDRIRQRLADAAMSSSPAQMRVLTKSGGVRWVETSSVRIQWEGRPAVQAFVLDITQRKQAEAQLQASLREKEALLKEIHHRVKNNLQVVSSLLELQSESIQDPQVLALFQESQSRIRAMGLIHEKFYRSADLASIEAPDYLQDLVDHLFGIYGTIDQPVSSVLFIDDIVLGVDTAVPCGLIVHELVANALKHAFPPDIERGGIVRVELHAMDADRLALTVSDDGVGLPPDLHLDGLLTLGLPLVDVLVQQLGGTLQVDRRSGTTFSITFSAHGRAGPNGETG
jgi:PAS domain S-box-containing protein